MDTSLKLYYVASDGTTRTFPEGNYEQAELHDFTVNKTRMGGAPTITATLEYPTCLDGEWGRVCHFDDVYVVFNGERYYLKATPPSSKSNDKLFYKHDLTFVSERSVLETTYMIDDLENQTQNIILSNNTQITFFGDIAQFVERINQSMYFSGIGDTCVYDTSTTPPTINPLPRTPNGDGFYVVVDSTVTNTDEVLVTLSNNTIADALKELFEKWGVPYYFTGRIIHVGDYEAITETTPTYADSDGVLGAGIDSVSGDLIPYEYGQPNSVLQVQRSNSTKQIYNRCSGTGSSDNIPYYYPNPTPSGTIHLEVNEMPGSTLDASDLTINSYLKFSNLGVNDALVWTQKTTDVSEYVSPQKEFYFNGRRVEFQVPQPPLVPPPGYHAEPAPVAQELEYGLESREFPIYDGGGNITGYETRYRFIPTTATLAVRVFLQKPYYKLNFDFSTECPTDVEWEFREQGGVIRFLGEGTAFDYNGNALQEGTYTLSFQKTYTPSDQNWYLLGSLPSRVVQVSVANLVADAEGWTGWYGDDQKLWVLQSSGASVRLEDYGLLLANGVTLVDGDSIVKVVDKWVAPQEKLMPYCYRLSDGRKKFYPAKNYPLYNTTDYDPDLGDDDSQGDEINNDNYLDENDEYYVFDNPYRRLKQKEHIYDMPDIKPSIDGMTNEDDQRVDMFEAFVYDDNDDNSGYFDENGNWNFNHPYFFAQLRPTDSFNLFDHAIDESKMTIAFTSGQCAPCEFEIAVDKETKKNLVQIDLTTGLPAKDADGDVICGRKGAVAPQNNSQQETKYTWTWIALKKDTSTYGESSVMPFNDGTVTIRPKACTDLNTNDGDTFVILHIEMPQAYVEAAEQRLTKEIIKQMNADNVEKFNKSLKYSKVYLGENQDLIDILNENVKVQARYNGITKDYFVSSYSYRVQTTSPIPEINIGGLVETVEELKMVAAAGGSFMQKMGEHISENFAELMMGVNKPFTRIVNQNNTQVTNQIKGDLPTDYVRTNMDLFANGIIIGSGGRVVQALPEGSDGQVLIMRNGKPYWGSIEIPDIEGNTTPLQSDFTIPSSYTEIQGLRTPLTAGVYLVNLVLSIKKGDVARNGVVTCYMTYNKAEICSTQAYITNYGQLCLATIVKVEEVDEEKTVKVYAFSESSMANNYSVASTIANGNETHTKASMISIVKLS